MADKYERKYKRAVKKHKKGADKAFRKSVGRKVYRKLGKTTKIILILLATTITSCSSYRYASAPNTQFQYDSTYYTTPGWAWNYWLDYSLWGWNYIPNTVYITPSNRIRRAPARGSSRSRYTPVYTRPRPTTRQRITPRSSSPRSTLSRSSSSRSGRTSRPATRTSRTRRN